MAEAPHDLPDGAPERVATDPAARGALYGVLARCVRAPDERLHAALSDGTLAGEVARLLDRTALDVAAPALRTDRGYEDLCALYNGLFDVGRGEVPAGADAASPPVPPYVSNYRSDASWSDVNVDLARAYEHFGVEMAGEQRRHHDFLPLVLDFAGYLCRREAAVDPAVDRARLDLHDRHLRPAAKGVAERAAAEPATGVYGQLAAFLDDFTAADVAAVADATGGEP